ncbi:MAG: hypothetical protein V4479_09650 [Actinomycetota bacterium]
MEDGLAFRVFFLRATARQWLPLVGCRYANEIGIAWSGRMLRLPLVLVCLVPVNVFRFFGTMQADIVVVVFAVLAAFGAIALSLFTRIRVASIAREVAFELSDAGLLNDGAADLISADRFAAWCSSAHLTPEMVRNVLVPASDEQHKSSDEQHK